MRDRLPRLPASVFAASVFFFGGCLHVAQLVARGPRRLVLQADGVEAILVEQHFAPIRVLKSNDFIMMMASVGHTWTQSSQNSQAYSSRLKNFA